MITAARDRDGRSSRSTRASTRAPRSLSRAPPYLYSTWGTRLGGRAHGSQEDHDPRRRPEPDRPGDRVRLLLRARVLRAQGARVRDHHGQLQPRDGVHRLRHVGPALLRAAHLRGRDEPSSIEKPEGRHRAVRRADAAQARGGAERGRGVPILGTPADAIDRAEDRERFEALLEKLLSLRRPRGRHRARVPPRRSRSPDRIGYPAGRPAELRARRTRDGDRLLPDRPRALHGGAVRRSRCATSQHDPARRVPARRDRGRRRLRVGRRAPWSSAGCCSTSRRREYTPATRRWCCPPTRCRRRCSATIRSSTRALALELGVVGLMNVQFAVRGSAVYVIEVNPRASRTIPFVSKAIGVPLAQRRGEGHGGRVARLARDRLARSCPTTSRSRSRCSRSRSSKASTPSSGPRCARPAK